MMLTQLERLVKRDVAELEERLQQLKRSGAALSTEMRAAASTLVNPGLCPQRSLEDAINSYQERWSGLCSDLQLTESDVAAVSGPIWERLQGRLTDFREADEALSLLENVGQIRAPGDSESLLAPVRQMLREAISRLQMSPWTETALVEDVRKGRHPLCRLVLLVTSHVELTDDQWVTEMNAVQQTFGVALSTALARGKLSMSTVSRSAAQQISGVRRDV